MPASRTIRAARPSAYRLGTPGDTSEHDVPKEEAGQPLPGLFSNTTIGYDYGCFFTGAVGGGVPVAGFVGGGVVGLGPEGEPPVGEGFDAGAAGAFLS